MNPHEQSYSVVRLFVLGSTSAYTCLKAPNLFALSVRANTVHPPVHQPTCPRIPMMTKKKTREDTEPKRGGTWTTARRPAKRNLFDAGTSPSPNRRTKQDYPTPQPCTLLEINLFTLHPSLS